tara:strand:- start:27 stop:467 length:441 start_codon:yes stop_codon:yes gene_type:complete
MYEGQIREYIEKNLKAGYSIDQIEQALKKNTGQANYINILNEYKKQAIPEDTSEIAKGKKTTLLIILILQFLFGAAITLFMFLGPDSSLSKLMGFNVLGTYIYYVGILSAINLLFFGFSIFFIINEKKVGYSMAFLISIFASQTKN